MEIKVQVCVADNPPAMPTVEQSKRYPAADIMNKICDYCREVDDGGRESCETQWEYLKQMFIKLQAVKQKTPEMLMVWKTLMPVIYKYAQYDSELAPLLDGAQILAVKEDDDA